MKIPKVIENLLGNARMGALREHFNREKAKKILFKFPWSQGCWYPLSISIINH